MEPINWRLLLATVHCVERLKGQDREQTRKRAWIKEVDETWVILERSKTDCELCARAQRASHNMLKQLHMTENQEVVLRRRRNENEMNE